MKNVAVLSPETKNHNIPESIQGLDLSMMKKKLMEEPPEGQGWSQEQADIAELWYRRYLTLILRYPDQTVVPNAPIDAFWHQHILDTLRYPEDCHRIFGKMIHHYPYFGLNGDADIRDEAFDDTNKLYRVEFGEDCRNMFVGVETKAQSCNHAGSGTGCGQGCGNG